MHPRLYPFVVNGPACACTDPRVAHVGINKYGLPQADLGCSACELCEHYTPLEAIDQAAETRQAMEIERNEARRIKVGKKVNVGVLTGIVVALPTSIVAPELFPWLMVPVVGAGLVNMATSTFYGWREGNLSTAEAALHAILVCAVLALFAALALDMPPIVLTSVAVIVPTVVAFIIGLNKDMKRSRRSLRLLAADFKDLRDQP